MKTRTEQAEMEHVNVRNICACSVFPDILSAKIQTRGTMNASGGSDGTVRIWNILPGAAIAFCRPFRTVTDV